MNKNMYIPNNIEFRIISAGAIATFKQDQAFDFNEIAHSKTYKFSRESKEILLLSYESWFKFISKLEKLFIRYHSQDIGYTALLSGHVDVLIDDCTNEIDDIMSCHPEIFRSDTRQILNRTNSVFIDMIFHVSSENIGNAISIVFPIMAQTISDSLHNLLFQLHEIEFLQDNTGETPFISYSDTCKLIIEKLGVFPVSHRANIYKEVFGADKFNIKNYSSLPIVPECISSLINNGMTIDYVEESNEMIRHTYHVM